MRISRTALVVALTVLIGAWPVLATPRTSDIATELLLGTAGGLGGSLIAITAIAQIAPKLESRAARIGVVISSVTVGGGLGAAIGVLAAGKLLELEGDVPGCLIGGLLGSLASAFIEPLLYLFGIPEGITEFLGLAMLPVLPAVGAVLGFNRTADPVP